MAEVACPVIETPCSENADHSGWDDDGNRTCFEHRHHADDWFQDPGSGKNTESGRARRRAIDACHIDCPMKMRLACLHEGLKTPNLQYGIFGGYTEAQRQEIAEQIAARTRRQNGVS